MSVAWMLTHGCRQTSNVAPGRYKCALGSQCSRWYVFLAPFLYVPDRRLRTVYVGVSHVFCYCTTRVVSVLG